MDRVVENTLPKNVLSNVVANLSISAGYENLFYSNDGVANMT